MPTCTAVGGQDALLHSLHGRRKKKSEDTDDLQLAYVSNVVVEIGRVILNGNQLRLLVRVRVETLVHWVG